MPSDDVYVNLITETKKAVKNLAAYAAGITAAILAVRKLVKIGGDLQKAYFDQQRAEVKLRSALRSTGHAVGISLTQLNKYADGMERATGVDADFITSAQALMVTFTKISGEVFPDAMKAASDMAVMFGGDLQRSAVSLGVALNDPIAGVGRLLRIGVSFTAAQKKTIQGFVEANDIMSAQKVILEELQIEFGGVAKAMGETEEAGINKLKLAFGGLQEIMGELIATEKSGLVGWLTKITFKAVDAANAIKAIEQATRGMGTITGLSAGGQASAIEGQIDAVETSIAALEKRRDTVGRRFLEARIFGGEGFISDEDLNAQIRLNEFQLMGLEKGLEIQVQLKAALDAQTETERAAAEARAAAAIEQQKDMDALMSAFESTEEGQRAALLTQIAYFETFKQGPVAIAVLEMLTAQWEELNKEAALFGAKPLAPGRGQGSSRGRAFVSPEPVFAYNEALQRVVASYEDLAEAQALAFTEDEMDAIAEAAAALEDYHATVMDIAAEEKAAFIDAGSSILGSMQTAFSEMEKAGIISERNLFNATKVFAAARMAINVSEAVTKALAIHPLLAVGVGIAGAAAILTVLAAQVPAMAEGGIVTRPTLALIGEKGPERVTSLTGPNRGGDTFITHIHAGTILAERGLRAIIQDEQRRSRRVH